MLSCMIYEYNDITHFCFLGISIPFGIVKSLLYGRLRVSKICILVCDLNASAATLPSQPPIET